MQQQLTNLSNNITMVNERCGNITTKPKKKNRYQPLQLRVKKKVLLKLKRKLLLRGNERFKVLRWHFTGKVESISISSAV